MREVFGFVKGNLSGAKRRKRAASGERGAGKGAVALVPASARRGTGARAALRHRKGARGKSALFISIHYLLILIQLFGRFVPIARWKSRGGEGVLLS